MLIFLGKSKMPKAYEEKGVYKGQKRGKVSKNVKMMSSRPNKT